jgi:hypothetical protein
MNKSNFNTLGSHEQGIETGRGFAQSGNEAKKENEKKAVVVIFGGGATFKKEFDIKPHTVNKGATPAGLGEASLDDNESVSIAQEIANKFPGAEVILSGPNGINEISTDLINRRKAARLPENILIYGFSSGASSATALTNLLNKNNIRVDQLTTVDPQGFNLKGVANAVKTRANPKDAVGLAVIGTPEIKNPTMVRDALNLVGTNKAEVEGAGRDEIKPDWARRGSPFIHRNMDDIASEFVIKRIGDRLKDLGVSRETNGRPR